jgi:lysophospholipase L1-like esterase
MKLLFAFSFLVWAPTSNLFAASDDSVKWQAKIDRFLAADKEHPTQFGGVVFLGSSSIRRWELEKSFPDEKYLNRGFGGSEICDSTHYFMELVAKHKPRIVVLYAGDNDIAHGKSAKQVRDDFRDFAKRFTMELPDAQMVFIAIKPSLARWHLADEIRDANARIAAECQRHSKFTFLDVWPIMLGEDGKPRGDIFLKDGLHMNEAGYKLWSDLLTPYLAE